MRSVTESHYNQQQHHTRENPGNGATRSVPRNRGRFRVQDIIKSCRSYRRFDESDRIDRKLLAAWVDAARLVASSGNAQPLRYAIVSDERACERVFSCCAWAKALPDWPGPEPGERPSAYIVVCRDNERTLADSSVPLKKKLDLQEGQFRKIEQVVKTEIEHKIDPSSPEYPLCQSAVLDVMRNTFKSFQQQKRQKETVNGN